jgi:renalase
LGLFDYVLWNCPPIQTCALVPQVCSWLERAKAARMHPCWGVMFGLESKWSVPFEGAFINDEGPIRWLARNSSKPERPQGLDCWVLHSDRNWASQNLEIHGDDIAELLLSELSRTVQIPMPSVIFRQAQRWLYASTGDRVNEACFWDASHGLGACGDWFARDHFEGAVLSGIALAGRILGTLNDSEGARVGQAKSDGSASDYRQLELF